MNTSNVSNDTPSAPFDLNATIRKFFSCNPLYLASAGLLLYGINRLSSAPSVAGAESAQITFNFAALFIYELLLVWTSIVLAKRAIWYDSLLLVGLENLFVLIPFSLVSRAVQLDQSLARNMCVAAALFAALKFWALKRYIPRLNLPPRLLAFGGIALGANVALSLGLRQIYDNPHALNSWLTFGWLGGLPALVALANLLPKPTRTGSSPEQRAWLPYAPFGIWIAVTASHLGGVGYVFSFKWDLALLAPVAWTLAWTLRAQTRNFNIPLSLQQGLPVPPFFAPFLALNDDRIFFVLSTLNTLGFAYLAWRSKAKLPLTLAVPSFLMAVAALPAEWTPNFFDSLSRLDWIAVCLTFGFLASIARLRDPRLTVVGGVICLAGTALLADRLALSVHCAFQLTLVLCIAHSLRWQDALHRGATTARVILCLLWIVQSISWLHTDPTKAFLSCSTCSLAVLAVWSLHGWLTRNWHPYTVPTAAGVVLFSAPGSNLVAKLGHLEPGYLAVAASFILFGLGTIAALTKKRWKHGQSPETP